MQIESEIQQEFIRWVRSEEAQEVRLLLLHSVPNGGKRGYKTAVTMKAEGQRKGVPDIMFPVRAGEYCGLAIEFKRPIGGVVSKEQKEYMAALSGQGWRVVICTSAEAAIKEVTNYLKT